MYLWFLINSRLFINIFHGAVTLLNKMSINGDIFSVNALHDLRK